MKEAKTHSGRAQGSERTYAYTKIDKIRLMLHFLVGSTLISKKIRVFYLVLSQAAHHTWLP